MNNHWGLLLASSSLWLAAVGGVRAAEGVDWKDRFLKEAPRRWEEYLNCKIVQGSSVSTLGDRNDAGKVIRRSHLEFKQNKTCAWILNQNLPPGNQTGNLYAINSRYAFHLQRKVPDKPWVIVGQDLTLADGYSLGYTPPTGVVRNWLGDALSVNGTALTRLYEVIKDPDFAVQRAAPLVRDGKTLVRIDFTSRPKEWKFSFGTKADWMPLAGGWIVFDPEHSWVIRECQVRMEPPPGFGASAEQMDGKFEYKEGQKGFPLLTRIVRTWSKVKQTAEFNLIEDDTVPDSDFTLTAFGFPEPVELQGAQSPTRWYLWAALAGVSCLALGTALRWRSKRSAA